MSLPKTVFSFCCLLLAFFLVGGCGDKKPAGMPKLQPTTLTITYDDGNPVVGATVQLFSTSGVDPRWNPLGTTDQNGLCTLHVLGTWEGAPEGEWTVCVTRKKAIYKEEDLESDLDADHERSAKPIGQLTLVDPSFNTPDMSELNATIVKGKNQITFKVGEKLDEYVAFNLSRGDEDEDEEL